METDFKLPFVILLILYGSIIDILRIPLRGPAPNPQTPMIQAKVLRDIFDALELDTTKQQGFLDQENLTLRDLHEPAKSIPFISYLRVFEHLAKDLGRPTLGLDLSLTMGPELVGAAGYMFVCSRNLEQALRAFSDGVFSIQDATHFSLINLPTPIGHYRITDHRLTPRNQDAEFSLGYVHRLASLLIGPDFAPKEVWFEHACPTLPSYYEQSFGCPVFFDQDTNALVFEPNSMRMKPQNADPHLVRILEHYLTLIDDRDNASHSFAFDVAQTLGPLLERHENTIEDVAKQMAISVTALRARLRSEGTTFRRVLLQTRMQMARRLLKDSGLNVLEIAQRLGYVETASFSRAFSDEVGLSPREFRKSAT